MHLLLNFAHEEETVKLPTLQALLKMDKVQPRKVILYLILQGQ